MLVRVQITNTPLSRRTFRLMVKLTVVLALFSVFGLNSFYAIGAYILITKLTARRTTPFTVKKNRALKKKADRVQS